MKKHFKLSLTKIIILSIIGLSILFILTLLLVDIFKYRLKASSNLLDDKFEQGSLINPYMENEKLIYKNSEAELYFDYMTTNIIIKKNGKMFETIPYNYFKNLEKDKDGNPKYDFRKFVTSSNYHLEHSKEKYLSPLNLTYIYRGIDIPKKLDGFNASIKNHNYKVYKLTNGVRVEYDFQERVVHSSWLPHTLSKDEFSALIKDNSDYKYYLEQVYNSEPNQKLVTIKENTTQDSLNKVYELWTTKYKLTDEELIEKNKKYSITQRLIKKPHFIIPVEYRLDSSGNLDVKVLSKRIKELSPDAGSLTLKLTDINLLPYFMRTANIKYSQSETHKDLFKDDYLFVPDGMGALIKPSEAEQSSLININFYNNKQLKRKNIKEANLLENNLLPFFGVGYNDRAVLADLKSGIGMANLEVINEQFFYQQNLTFRLKEYEKYEFVKGKEIIGYEPINKDDNISITYYLFSKQTSYFDFVKYLQNIYFLTKKTVYNPIMLEVIGAIKSKEHILGIPYNKVYPMTTYSQFKKIEEQFSGNYTFKYSGFTKGGLNSGNTTKITYEKTLGSRKEFKELLNSNTYLDLNMVSHYTNKEGYFKNSRHGVKLVGGVAASFSTINRRDLLASNNSFYYLTSPKYLDIYSDYFLKNIKLKNYSINDLGNNTIASYTQNISSPDYGYREQAKVAQKIRKQGNLMLSNSYFHIARYANILENMPLATNAYLAYYQEIPFLQLLFAPFLNIYSKSLNNDYNNNTKLAYLYAKMSQTGLKYTLTYNHSLLTKESKFNYLYATSFENKELIDEINNNYKELNQFNKDEIINHELIARNKFRVHYHSGIKEIYDLDNLRNYIE